MIFSDALACITGGITEAFYGMPPKLPDMVFVFWQRLWKRICRMRSSVQLY